MDTPGDPQLGYRISTEPRFWSMLTCEAEWRQATSIVVMRAKAARTREVSMEVKDMVRN